jgi:curved DNA-binding protein CbpA
MARPSEIKDLYERLGISPSASQDDIKKAYRTLAHQWHPDKNLGNEVESRLEFIAVSEAYERLSEEGHKIFEEMPKMKDEEAYILYKELFDIINGVSPELGAAWKIWGGDYMSETMKFHLGEMFRKTN